MVGSRWWWQRCAVMVLAVGAGGCGAGSDPAPAEAERPEAPAVAPAPPEPAVSNESPPAQPPPAEVALQCLGEHMVAPTPPALQRLPCTELRLGADGTEQGRTLRRYDAGGRLLSSEGGWFSELYSYDAAGRVTSLMEQGRIERFSYDTCGRVLSNEGQSRNTAWRYTRGYDAEGRLVSVTGFNRYFGGPREEIVRMQDTYTYDARGQLLEWSSVETGPGEWYPRASLTHHTYDEQGRRVRTEERIEGGAGGGTVTEFAYDDAGRLLREQSTENGRERGVLKVYTYDAEGRRSTLHVGAHERGTPLPPDSRTSWTYPEEGGVIETTEYWSGSRRSTTTDAEGREVAWSASYSGSVTQGSRTYGSRGELLRYEEQQTTPSTRSAQLEESTYDDAGRLLRVERRRELSGIEAREPLHTEKRYAYDASGQLTGSESWNLDVTPPVLTGSVRYDAVCRPPGS